MKVLLPAMLIHYGPFGNEPAFAHTWTQTGAPTNYWNSIAASADGTKLVAVVYGGGIYTSTNSGATWTQTGAPSGFPWESVASSADGTKLVAAGFYDHPIYVSTNSGVNWSTYGPGENWQSVACSSDGNKLVAVANINGPIYTSTNSGTTWTQATSAPSNCWQSVASSADGNKLVAAVGGSGRAGPIYVSTNSGTTWTQAPNAPSNCWQSVASSADGNKLVAVSQLQYPAVGGSIFTSTNSGMIWTSNNVPGEPWSSVASSADGIKLMAVAYNMSFSSSSGFSYAGGIFTSANSGATWTQTIGPSNIWWYGVASADGNKFVVAVSDGGIYTSQTAPSPRLNLAPSKGNLTFSWIVPSTNFVLQQNSDLTAAANWVTLTNKPVLNLTNLQDEVRLSPAAGKSFFRLKSQ
jgi:hypothetical protein